MAGAVASGAPFRYWAFISYSHQDEKWARWLLNALETYRVPAKLPGRHMLAGPPKRIFPVFRDRDELAGSSDLGESIRTALAESQALVVICSPNSAASKWVNEEVRLFKAQNSHGRVLCLVVDGEPNASERPDGESQECFPRAVRYHVDSAGVVTGERVEVLAADARDGKDSPRDAQLKLIAGILGVGLDQLKDREHQRRVKQSLAWGPPAVLLAMLASGSFLTAVDREVRLPFGDYLRRMIDRHELSVFRPVQEERIVQEHAARTRRELFRVIADENSRAIGILQESFRTRAASAGSGVWSHAQTLTALLSTPEASNEELRGLLRFVESPFVSDATLERAGVKYGWNAWVSGPDNATHAASALWVMAALACALGRPGLVSEDERIQYEKWLFYTQQVLETYRPQDAAGGWAFFPLQPAAQVDAYTTALALQALLEVRRSGLSWMGSNSKRDELIRDAASWLIRSFEISPMSAGWRAHSETVLDGVSLFVYASLLQMAEVDGRVTIPETMSEAIANHVIASATRTLGRERETSTFTSLPFVDYRGQQVTQSVAIRFLWHPWAINAAAYWLRRPHSEALPEDVVRVRRALGHLVVDIAPGVEREATYGWMYVAAETLYGLRAIPPS